MKPVAKPERLAIPSKQSQTAAEQVILGIYKADWTKRTVARRPRRLPWRRNSSNKRSIRPMIRARNAIFIGARNWPPRAATRRFAFSVADKLAERFVVEGAEEKFNLLLALQKNARTPEAVQALLPYANNAIDQAIADDKYDVASKSTLGLGLGRQVAQSALVAQAKIRAGEIEQTKKEYAKSLESAATLRKAA